MVSDENVKHWLANAKILADKLDSERRYFEANVVKALTNIIDDGRERDALVQRFTRDYANK